MEDDDSADELIKRSTHRKRTAPWDVSDSDDEVDDSEEGESDSDEEEGDVEGEENEEEDDEEDEEEEDAVLTEDGVFGETSTATAVISSDEDADKCPICLNSFSNQPVATPENCEHYFCLDCILAWAKNANSCPVDRIAFNSIYLRKSYGGKVQKIITVQKPVKEDEEVTVGLDLEQTNCEVCGGSDREDRLLLCDGCDAGYHMECLTPPLDSVPVEEWFCPECVANNNNSGSEEELNRTQTVPSTAQPTTSRSQSRAAGPTRAIARTQHSERVRANVNRHRITQHAPTNLIQSTWLDETINAVVAGLNTAIYVRDLTPRAPTRRRRTTGTRRKVTKKKPLSVKGKKGRSTKRRRKRKGKSSKSKRTLVGKKVATPRSRIANSLGLSKDKNNCSLPTVCRPSEHTLSSMRADIGAASLSIYGDPSDLDPFIDREQDEQEDIVTSLLLAKRRGISHSAFRSHQPVARPVSTGMSRRAMDVSQTRGVVEAAPVPDLLGSILSGQSMLLMDSSDVVINRDGSLKASQTASSSTLKPGSRKCSYSEESNVPALTAISPILEESSSSNHHNRHLPGSFHSDLNIPFSQDSSRVPSDHHSHPSHSPDLSPRGFQPPLKNRPPPMFGPSLESAHTSYKNSDPSHFRKTGLPSQSQPTKTPIKPTWVDVDILPKIPKIKRDAANDGKSGTSSNSSARNNTNSNIPLMNFAGDKNGQQRIPQPSNTDRRPHSQAAGSSQAFSNSFSFSSFTVPPSTPPCNTSVSSSSSSSISFRINPSGNSWHSRRLSLPTSPASGSSTLDDRRKKMDAAKKRQEHLDRQKVLASRTATGDEQNLNNVYDPSNPTMSDSSSSDGEGENINSSARQLNSVPNLAFRQFLEQSKQPGQVKTETHESEDSQELPRSDPVQTPSRMVSCASGVVRVRIESTMERKIENQAAVSGIKVKTESGLSDSGKDDMFEKCVKSYSGLEAPVTFSPVQHSLDHLQTKDESGISCKIVPPNKEIDSSGCTPSFVKLKVKEEIKSDSTSPPKDLVHKNKTFTNTVSAKEQHSNSSSAESDKGKTKDRLVANQEERQKKTAKDRERRSRERKTRSSSDSSQSSSPKRSSKNRRQRSSSDSRSSSRERSRWKKHEQKRQERTDDGERGRNRKVSNDRTFGHSWSRSQPGGRSKDHRRRYSRSKSPSTSPYRSRSKERRREHPPSHREDTRPRLKDKKRPRSRSSSRERRKIDASSKRLPENPVPDFSSSKYNKDTKNESKEEKIPKVKNDSTFPAKTKKEHDSGVTVITATEIGKEVKHLKMVKKKDQQSIDMFRQSPITTHGGNEDSFSTSQEIKKDPNEREVCKSIKTEDIYEITQIEVEPISSELPVTLPYTLDSHQEEVKVPAEEAGTIECKASLKQPPESDEDNSVDMLLDNIDFVKPDHTEDVNANVKKEDTGQEAKTEAEQVPAACKGKIQAKRVTWNIQEPDVEQPNKSESKLALYKKKHKQEAASRPVSITTTQDTSGPDSVSDLSKRDDAAQPTSSGCQTYLKKLHMQERAIEEVKLAIKPFYQKREINKEEYKEILRKAVQKVCHSKSGEINPVKVGNLVKAYVEKYKHARKRYKSETEPVKTSGGH
ncbi:PHD and RING finger domain-containing protein 1 isoform X2 [Corythoichthys intestinalis]|uniref:PHD and RING finger domain-containing protein 1 isoform X2 n=1 Tax=Corythoichthys intestinalis TaxID=161448 RepID=UPI0025A67469|nr:PHD and RING finger domain-containing protein 1 isoform X2 [Corythoichthys intestinalis]